jgi:hypothetical protein
MAVNLRMAYHSGDAVAEDRHVRVVGATCSGVIRMAEVPRGGLGQGRFLNRLRFAEVNAEKSIYIYIFTHRTNIFLSLCVGYMCFSFHNMSGCNIHSSACTPTTAIIDDIAVREPRLASRYRVFLRSQLHLHTTHL